MTARSLSQTPPPHEQARDSGGKHAPQRESEHWYASVLAVLLTGLVAFSVVGMAATLLQIFYPVVVVPIAAAVWLLLWRIWQSRTRDRPSAAPNSPSYGRAAPVFVCVFAVIVAIFNGINSSEHLLTDRDPGAYVIGGRTLATTGTMVLPTNEGPFADSEAVTPPQGAYTHSDSWLERRAERGIPLNRSVIAGLEPNGLYPPFMHLVSVWLAYGSWVAGTTGLLVTDAVLGALALLMVFAVASRFMRPGFAAAATVAFGLNFVFIWFSRDAYSEIPSLLFFFGGLWMLFEARRSGLGTRALVAGLALGAPFMARLDTLLLLPLLILYVGVEAVAMHRNKSSITHAMRQTHYVTMCALGLGTSLLLGLADGLLMGRHYVVDQGFRSALSLCVALITLAVVVAANAMLRRFPTVTDVILTKLTPIGITSVSLFLVGFAILALPIGLSIAKVAGVATWLTWYMTVFGVALGVGGLAYLQFKAVTERGTVLLLYVVATAGFLVFMIYDPHISRDQIWAMRRFLPIVLPGLFVAGFAALSAIFVWGVRNRASATSVLMAVVAGASILISAIPTARLASASDLRPLRGLVDDVCDALGPDAAVVVTGGNFTELNLPNTIEAFCGVPVASASGSLTPDEIRRLRGAWEDQGRQLYLVGTNPSELMDDESELETVLVVEDTLSRLEMVPREVKRAPRRVVTQDLELIVDRVR